MNKPTQSVVRLSKPISKSNRNITADNWFTSLETTDELERMGLTYVGTMRKDKREVPKEFLPNRQRPANSARFAINCQRTLVSFTPEKNKGVILISTMHHDFDVNDVKNKPEIVCYYKMWRRPSGYALCSIHIQQKNKTLANGSVLSLAKHCKYKFVYTLHVLERHKNVDTV